MTHALTADAEPRVRFSVGLEVALREEAGATVVSVVGDVDCASAQHLGDVLDNVIAGSSSDVVIDASRISFLDSTGVGVLASALRHLEAGQRSLTVRAPSRAAYRVIDLAGMTKVFDVPRTQWLPAVGR